MSIRIPDLLEGILEATAAEAAAKARLATLRAALEDEARRRLAAEGAAPSWNAPQLGKVRLEPAGAWTATVADASAFGSWVAEHHPTEATATVVLNAGDLADALQALKFIGVEPLEARAEARSAFEEQLIGRLVVEVEETGEGAELVREFVIVDPTTGLAPDGLTGTRKPDKLVVTLDKDRRTAAITEARTQAAELLEAATDEDAPGPDLVELDERRRELEDLHATTLATIAKAHGLGSSGTKAALAERIARAELATGNVIRTAATVEAPEPTPAPLPDDVEVEEVTTLEPPAQDQHRNPYVGAGADGARRSAQIDREEVDGLDRDDPRRDQLLASADAWDRQAAELDADNVIPGEFPQVEPDSPLPVGENAPGPGPFTDETGAPVAGLDRLLEAVDTADDADTLAGRSREVLRGYAKAIGVSAAGTKADVIDRLVAAGVTATQVDTWAASA